MWGAMVECGDICEACGCFCLVMVFTISISIPLQMAINKSTTIMFPDDFDDRLFDCSESCIKFCVIIYKYKIKMNFNSSNYLSIKKKYLEFLKKKEVGGKTIVDKVGKFNTFYLPLSDWIYSTYKKDNKTKIIGLSGGQGAGKSTITGILKFILKKKYGLELCIFSIDDFYKTKSERKKMSKKVHPLFLTRGVPGTHDVKLINKTFKNLKKKIFKPVLIPKFDKSTDDRFKKSKWQKIKNPPPPAPEILPPTATASRAVS